METLTKNKIDVIIDHITPLVQSNKDNLRGLNIEHGLLGLAFYNYCLHLYYGEEQYKVLGNQYLEETFEQLNNGYVSHILYRELANIGFFVESCAAYGYGVENTNEVLDHIDEILIPVMEEEMAKENFDPVTGVLHYAYYFLQRLPSQPNLEVPIRKVVQFLKDISHENEKGIYWHSKLKDDDAIYLGITHGSANIVQFLVNCNNTFSDLNLTSFIEKSCAYIRNNELKDQPLAFPIIVGHISSNGLYPKSFCYGDYGTLYGLYAGYKHLNDEEGQQYCIELFKDIYSRGHETPFLVAGPSLLYGHAGLAMLFKRFHEESGQAFFQSVYEERVQYLYNLFDETDQYLGYQGYWNQGESFTNYCFNEGVIGIACTFMGQDRPDIQALFDQFFYIRKHSRI